MKLIKSWRDKYIGIVHKNMAYYLAWNHPTCRDWGWSVEYFNDPIKRFSAYYISLQWHWDNGVED